MNSVDLLFAEMDQVFSLKKNKTFKKYCEKLLEYREFCQSGKVGTML